MGDWIILRCSAARTLKLAASLQAAGLEVWTPTGVATRVGRGKQRREQVATPAPITPTFVFAPAGHVRGMLGLASAMASPHPSFSVFRHRDRVPVIRDGSLNALRQEEEKQQTKQRKATRRSVRVGATVKMEEGAFAGMTGTVERGNDRKALVNFGGGFVVEIATYLLPEGVLCGAASAQ
ncbi:transcription termination/antitermination protein NusG [Sphingomonas sp.]|uniref:transcription termination/antitermination protein NusG n=1 Tax=Sphingomonas sp. TaxID=28214 RepID=UPI003AFFE59E